MSRFADISDAELAKIIHDKDAKNTHKATSFAWSVFKHYLDEKRININPEVIGKQQLSDILMKFYVELRKKDGEMYSKSAFRSIKHGLQRKFKALQEIDIIGDPAFNRSENVFSAQCVLMKKRGLANVQHKPPISENDIKRLYSSGVFSTTRPKSLLRKVFFELMFFLCRRGQENLRTVTKSSFTVKKDEDGVEYIIKIIDELDKNHRENDSSCEGGVIVATGRENCPVKSFKLYLDKLNPKVDVLFQRPKAEAPQNGPWFDAQVLGIKSLEKMMKNISYDAGLKTLYTNHSIRATCITLLDNAGNEARHIMSVSGHKSETSIRSYSKTCLGQKRKMSTLLSSTINSIPEKKSVTDVNFGIDNRSFLDSVILSPTCMEKSSTSSSECGKESQKILKELSALKRFSFQVGIHKNADASCTTTSPLPSSQLTPTSTHQHQDINQNNSSSTNDFFSALGKHPIFYNCTFNLNK